MTIESNDDGNGFMLLRIRDGLADDLLVAEMDAVENSNGDADFKCAGFQFVGGADDIHNGKISSKLQLPSSREASNSNLQISLLTCGANELEFDAWIFIGAWMLEFGAFTPPSPISKMESRAFPNQLEKVSKVP